MLKALFPTLLISFALLLAACGPNRAVQDLEIERADLLAQIAGLESDLDSAEGRVAELEANLESETRLAAERLAEVEAQLGALQGDASALRVALESARGANAELEQQLGAALPRSNELEAEPSALTEEHNALLGELGQRARAIDGLSEERLTLAAERDVAQQQRQEAIDLVVGLEVQLARLEAELEQQLGAALPRSNELEAEPSALTEEHNALLGELEQRARTIDGLSEERLTLAAERDVAQQQRQEAIDLVVGLEVQLARLEAELEQQLGAALPRSNELEAEPSALTEEHNALLGELEQRARTIDGLSEERLTLAAERDVAQQQRQEAIDLVVGLEVQLARLGVEEVPGRLADTQAQLADVQAQLEALRAEVANTQVQLATVEDPLDATQTEPSEVRAALVRAEAEAATLASSLEQTLGELTAVQDERDAIQARLATLEGERDATLAEAAAVAASLEQVTAERDTLLGQLNQLENRNESLAERLERTAVELDAAQSLAVDVSARYETLLQEAAQLDVVSDARRQQLDATRTALEVAQNEVARLTGARGIYTVQSADSLSSIARFFYRNGNRWSDIAEANSFLIGDDPDLIYAGMVLIVPQ